MYYINFLCYIRVLFLCYTGQFYLPSGLCYMGRFYLFSSVLYESEFPLSVLCCTRVSPPIVFIPRGMKMENENNIKPSHLWIFFENPRLLTMIIPIIINDYQDNHKNLSNCKTSIYIEIYKIYIESR